VLDAPMFRKQLEVLESKKEMSSENSGFYHIKKIKIKEK
jgi:diphthamide synthase (EF-2-diphthine--ammonia ligase)